MNGHGLLRTFAVPLAAAIIFAGVVRATVLRLYEVPSASMSPTLEPGDLIAATPFDDGLRRGDVVVFRADDGTLFVKRIVALPGDHIMQARGVLRLNGRELFEPYVFTALGQREFCEIVPADHVWVLGDNRPDSHDSRDIGPIPVESIESKLLAVVYSPD